MEGRAAACAVRGTCCGAGKCSANLPLPPSPPRAVPSRVPPSALTKPLSAPSSSVLAPQFICTASLACSGLLLICLASLSPLCSLPAGEKGWLSPSPVSWLPRPSQPSPRLLLLLGSLCELCSPCSPRGGCV